MKVYIYIFLGHEKDTAIGVCVCVRACKCVRASVCTCMHVCAWLEIIPGPQECRPHAVDTRCQTHTCFSLPSANDKNTYHRQVISHENTSMWSLLSVASNCSSRWVKENNQTSSIQYNQLIPPFKMFSNHYAMNLWHWKVRKVERDTSEANFNLIGDVPNMGGHSIVT